MFRIDVPTAAATLPTPAAPGTPGFWADQNAALGIAGTIFDADWANGIQEELISILTAAGIAPNKAAHNQVVAAIVALISSASPNHVAANVAAATTTNLPAYTYANGTAGVGATLTANANGAFPTIDTVAAALNNRYWIKNETSGNAPYNGIYQLTTLGTGSTPWVLTRTADADSPATLGNMIAYVSGGSQAGYGFGIGLAASAITVGTTALNPYSIAPGAVAAVAANLAAEITRAEGAESTLTANLAAETTAREAADAFLQSQIPGGTTTQGTWPAPTESSYAGGNNTWYPDTPIEYTGTLIGFSAAVVAADSAAVLVVASQSGGDMYVQSMLPLPLAAGVNTFTGLNIPVQEGWFVGLYTYAGNVYYTSGGPGTFYSAGTPATGGQSYTTVGSVTMSMGWELLYGVEATVTALQNQITGTSAAAIGVMPAQTTSSFSSDGGTTDFIMQPFPYDGTIRQVQLGAHSSNVTKPGGPTPPLGNGYAVLVIATMNGSNQFTTLATCDIAINSPYQTIDAPVFLTSSGNVLDPIPAGAYLGLFKNGTYLGSGGGVGVVTSTAGWRYTTGIPTTNTASTFVSQASAPDIGCTFDGGAEGRLAALELGMLGVELAGLSNALRNGADPTGTNDATSALAAASAMQPSPLRLPQGMAFKATSIPFLAHGVYGRGKLLLTDTYGNQVNYVVPSVEKDESLTLKLRSRFSRQISSGSPLSFFGDSITSGFYCGTYVPYPSSTYTPNNALAWLETMQASLNYDYAPGSYPCSMTPNSGGPDTPAMFGMTLSSGVTYGSNGPIGQSYVLPAGEKITFTTYTGGANVALDQLDVFYTQQSGAGSLVFAYNGTTYKTLSCAGATVKDKFSGPSATGQTAAGSYTITASGGPVEITGIVRLRNALATAGTPNPLYFMRNSHGFWTTGNFGTTPVASAIAQAQNLQAASPPGLAGAAFQGEAFIALGTNEMGNPSDAISPAQYATNLTAMVNQLAAAGYVRVNLLGMLRALWSVYSGISGMNAQRFDQYMAAMQSVCDSFNGYSTVVRMCDFGGIDWADETLLYSNGAQGVHPNSDGHFRYAQKLMQWRAEN